MKAVEEIGAHSGGEEGTNSSEEVGQNPNGETGSDSGGGMLIKTCWGFWEFW